MGYVERYMEQAGELARAIEGAGDTFYLVMAEGDSTDGTGAWLAEYIQRAPFAGAIFTLPHGGPVFGSENNPTRWRNIARTWNGLYSQLGQFVGPNDRVIYVETDLIWNVDTMLRLLNHVKGGLDAVSPMSFHGSVFYDIWGYRGMDAWHFSGAPPYHHSLNGGELVQILSSGSCMVMSGQVALTCRFAEQDAMLGHSIYDNGFKLWLDPTLRVDHP
jgi:hypothetical protein